MGLPASNPNERRRAARISAPDFDVVYWVPAVGKGSNSREVGRVIDISPNGMYVSGLSMNTLNLNGNYHGMLVFPSCAFEIHCVVSRKDEIGGVGLSFSHDCPEGFTKHLQDFLSELHVSRSFYAIHPDMLSADIKEPHTNVYCYLTETNHGNFLCWEDKRTKEPVRFEFAYREDVIEWDKKSGLMYFKIVPDEQSRSIVKGSDLLDRQQGINAAFCAFASSVIGNIPNLNAKLIHGIRTILANN